MRRTAAACSRKSATLPVICLAAWLLAAACRGDGGAPDASHSGTAPPATSARETAGPLQTADPALVTDLAMATPLAVAYGAGRGDLPSDQPGLTHGDYNGDGLEDVLIGARFADPAAGEDAGSAYVIFGRSDLGGTIDFAAGEQDLTIAGPSAGAALGFSAATADLNGDGADDVIVGAPFDVSGGRRVGSVHVFFGPLAAGALDLASSAADVTLAGVSESGFFGDSLASGDVNGDGLDDLVIGSTFAAEVRADGATGTAGGAVFVFFGRERWPARADALGAAAALYGEERFDELGDFVASGDINGDGIDDIVATAEAADGPANSRGLAATVYAVYGSHGLGGTLRVADGDADLTVHGAQEQDTLGFALAAGDLDGDGVDDLAMSAHLASTGGRERSGAVYVLYGRAGLPPEIDLADPPPYAARIAGDRPGDLLATSTAIADVDGDGENELLLGGSFADVAGRADAGAVYVLRGRGLTGLLELSDALRYAFYGADASGRLGANVAAANVSGGSTAIIAIAETADGPDAGRPQAGRVYFLQP